MKLITELNPHGYKTNENVDKNLAILFMRVMELQAAYGKPFKITSGLRDAALQEKLIAEGKTKAIHSLHLAGCAADIYDPKKLIKIWLKDNITILDSIGLWCEDFLCTPTWLHVQIQPPRSMKRIFTP